MANIPKVKPNKSILLKNVPEDIQKILIEKTEAEKKFCKCERPQDYSLYKIVRDWDQSLASASLVIAFDGEFLVAPDADVQFAGNRVCVTFNIPITSGVGALLNYRRINGK